jgi:hypothetical protein
MGWIDECTSHMKNSDWTKDKCIEISKNYKSRTEWSIKNQYSYHIARTNNWLNECIPHK